MYQNLSFRYWANTADPMKLKAELKESRSAWLKTKNLTFFQKRRMAFGELSRSFLVAEREVIIVIICLGYLCGKVLAEVMSLDAKFDF